MQVDGCYLRYARFENVPDVRILEPASWLGEREMSEFSRLNNEQRQRSWLAGRRLAKRMILAVSLDDSSWIRKNSDEWALNEAEFLRIQLQDRGFVETPAPATQALSSVSILTRNTSGQADRPQVIIDGSPFDHSLSISHSDRGVLVALGATSGVEIGVDLIENIQETPGLLATWFTPREREALDDLPASEVSVFWAIKEAVYKACQQGESFRPRKIEVSRCQQARYECHYEERAKAVQDITIGNIDGQIAVIAVVEREPYKTPLAV